MPCRRIESQDAAKIINKKLSKEHLVKWRIAPFFSIAACGVPYGSPKTMRSTECSFFVFDAVSLNDTAFV